MQINNLTIIPNWRLEDLKGEQLHVLFLPLLEQIGRHSKLTKAAENCGLSYRHAWNILRQAEAFFGHPITVMERGRGASLTELGKVLLRANQRIEARLHTQVETLTMELNSDVHRALSDQIGILPIYASHGYAVALIPHFLKNYQAELHYHGPADALRALVAGECKIAGFTWPLFHRLASEPQYRALLESESICIRQFIQRQQGLIVSPSAEASVSSIKDVARLGLRFINRQPRSGTRELFDQVLDQNNLNTSDIIGYDNHEYTHSAVAAHVATGMAEVGFGVKAAAARFDLPFVPVTEDRYYWASRIDLEADVEQGQAIKAFVEMLKNPKFQHEVNDLSGYKCVNSGDVISVQQLFRA